MGKHTSSRSVNIPALLQIGNYIQHKGGVVTAEELAPYLDVPAGVKDADSIVVEESYMIPALVRFGGSPDVDSRNNIIYKFPSLQKTGRQQVRTKFTSLKTHMLAHGPFLA